MIVCRQCGQSAREGEDFCESCGAFLEWEGEKVEPAARGRAGAQPHCTAPWRASARARALGGPRTAAAPRRWIRAASGRPGARHPDPARGPRHRGRRRHLPGVRRPQRRRPPLLPALRRVAGAGGPGRAGGGVPGRAAPDGRARGVGPRRPGARVRRPRAAPGRAPGPRGARATQVVPRAPRWRPVRASSPPSRRPARPRCGPRPCPPRSSRAAPCAPSAAPPTRRAGASAGAAAPPSLWQGGAGAGPGRRAPALVVAAAQGPLPARRRQGGRGPAEQKCPCRLPRRS